MIQYTKNLQRSVSMKLNEKCMKDILQICVNDIHVMESGGTLTRCKMIDFPDKLPQYSTADVLYSLVKLLELNYITLDTNNKIWDEHTKVRDVTYCGHKFLEKFQIG